jgi:hypothetical protein
VKTCHKHISVQEAENVQTHRCQASEKESTIKEKRQQHLHAQCAANPFQEYHASILRKSANLTEQNAESGVFTAEIYVTTASKTL